MGEPALIIAGTRITLDDIEMTARAFLADDPAPFVSMDYPAPPGWRPGRWPYVMTVMLRDATGRPVPVEVPCHPHPLCLKVLCQMIHAALRDATIPTSGADNLAAVALVTDDADLARRKP